MMPAGLDPAGDALPRHALNTARMSLYDSFARPLLFRLSPDRSHALAHAALRVAAPWRAAAALGRWPVDDTSLRCTFAGVDLPNPIGLAAGFDKNCELVDALACFGFGFLTVGSIMPLPRYGNPFPRLVRYPQTQSLADAMGVPSRGRDYCVARLRAQRRTRTPLFANVGGFTAAEIADSFLAVEPYVDAVEISLMCPNVKPGEQFDEIRLLREVLVRIEARQKPAIVRVPNDTAVVPDRLAELIERCIASGVAGLKVAGGKPVPEPRLGTKQGTLHGRAIFERALANVERAAAIARGRIPIKGNGGVSSGADALAMLRAGATCVDTYSAFVYRGWGVARDINRELIAARSAQDR
jgi:dihydroorotate dehydrogenase (fumarate)/dihydroorotate dehydrogenase